MKPAEDGPVFAFQPQNKGVMIGSPGKGEFLLRLARTKRRRGKWQKCQRKFEHIREIGAFIRWKGMEDRTIGFKESAQATRCAREGRWSENMQLVDMEVSGSSKEVLKGTDDDLPHA